MEWKIQNRGMRHGFEIKACLQLAGRANDQLKRGSRFSKENLKKMFARTPVRHLFRIDLGSVSRVTFPDYFAGCMCVLMAILFQALMVEEAMIT